MNTINTSSFEALVYVANARCWAKARGCFRFIVIGFQITDLSLEENISLLNELFLLLTQSAFPPINHII